MRRFLLPLAPWGNRVPPHEELERVGRNVGCQIRYQFDPPQILEIRAEHGGHLRFEYAVEVYIHDSGDLPQVGCVVHEGERGVDL